MSGKVTTYQSPDGTTRIDLCDACEMALREAGAWPHDGRGVELCQVHYGWHSGRCPHCRRRQADAAKWMERINAY